jgi:alkylation response protein AidB-like acyl-CoA dehydrogenase
MERVTVGPKKLIVDDRALPSLDTLTSFIADTHATGRAVALHSVTRESLLLVVGAFEPSGSIPGDRIEHGARIPECALGHAEIVFNDVRVPKSNFIAGPGRGFEVAQGRLGPGRIHHCMRAIGAAERALERLCQRAVSRVAFGKPLANLGGNRDVIANCRMAIDQARLLTLKAAWALDRHGVFAALTDISAIKVIAPNVLQMVVDAAIQIHGGEGMADPELSLLMGMARALRIADGPDEVHRGMVARLELKKYA